MGIFCFTAVCCYGNVVYKQLFSFSFEFWYIFVVESFYLIKYESAPDIARYLLRNARQYERSSYKNKFIDMIKKVQRRATKLSFVLTKNKLWKQLKKLSFPTLTYRRIRGDTRYRHITTILGVNAGPNKLPQSKHLDCGLCQHSVV